MKNPLQVRLNLPPKDYDSGNEASQSRWAKVFRNLLAAKKGVARRYNMGRRSDKFVEGVLVRYRLNLSSYKGQNISTKLLLSWSSPLVIVRKTVQNVVLLANTDMWVIVRRAHVSQLKPCVK